MARNPESDTATPADPERIRRLLMDVGVISPLNVTPLEAAINNLGEFPDTEEGRRDFARAMRALMR